MVTSNGMAVLTYPPPSVVGRSRASWVRRAVFVVTLALLVGTCAVSRWSRQDMAKPDPAAGMGHGFDVTRGRADPVAIPAGLPAEAADVATPAPLQRSVDGRQPDHWYSVARLGDGPAAILSRTGGGWDYAFACTAATRTIEFIAVNVGNPAGFDQQYMRVGRTKLMMDATYAKDGGGTISTRLPASHPFFNSFASTDPSMELQLLADRKVVIPIGPEVVRLIRDCGGNPVAPAAEPARGG